MKKVRKEIHRPLLLKHVGEIGRFFVKENYIVILVILITLWIRSVHVYYWVKLLDNASSKRDIWKDKNKTLECKGRSFKTGKKDEARHCNNEWTEHKHVCVNCKLTLL
jgi:hypothetical protein